MSEKELLTFSVKDGQQEAWDESVSKNADSYGAGVMRYAARWANMVEAKIADGVEIVAAISETEHTADTEGITVAMFGCAVSILAQVWEHGETLRRWHNHEIQLGDEGDKANEEPGAVLNPAVMCNSKKS